MGSLGSLGENIDKGIDIKSITIKINKEGRNTILVNGKELNEEEDIFNLLPVNIRGLVTDRVIKNNGEAIYYINLNQLIKQNQLSRENRASLKEILRKEGVKEGVFDRANVLKISRNNGKIVYEIITTAVTTKDEGIVGTKDGGILTTKPETQKDFKNIKESVNCSALKGLSVSN